MLILPTAWATDFRSAPPEGLASVLQEILGRLRHRLQDPPVNVWFHCAPAGTWAGTFHWHVHVVPRLTVEGGWELGAGMPINVMAPEQAAEFLR